MYKYPKIRGVGDKDNREMFAVENDVHTVHVEEKLDGGNGSFWLDNEGTLNFASRNLNITNDKEHSFVAERAWIIDNLRTAINPDFIYYVEYMKKHTLQYYEHRPMAIGIDIMVKETGKFLSRKAKEEEFARIGIPVVPLLGEYMAREIRNGDISLHAILENKSAYGDCKIEGIVLKMYDVINPRTNRQYVAKLVNESFQETNKAVFNSIKKQQNDSTKFCKAFVTPTRVTKTILKLYDEGNNIEMAMMKVLPRAVLKDIFEEEADEIIKFDDLCLRTIKKNTIHFCRTVLQEMINTPVTYTAVEELVGEA